MVSKPDLTDPDNPEWTEEMFARARAEEHLLPPDVHALIRRPPGRPPQSVVKRAVKLRLDPDVIERFKAGGPGWQSRMNEVLRKSVGL
jgi:uncharacterized protein (DUF4415 family)